MRAHFGSASRAGGDRRGTVKTPIDIAAMMKSFGGRNSVEGHSLTACAREAHGFLAADGTGQSTPSGPSWTCATDAPAKATATIHAQVPSVPCGKE